MVKINLGNKVLNINLKISKGPNFKRLENELREYFSENEIEGRKILNFEFDSEFTNCISPKNPYIEGSLSGGDYEEDLKEIGNKYGIKDLGFIYWCYHK